MLGDDDGESSFARWLCQSLDGEALDNERTGGRRPDRPICLSELEALGLLVLAIDAGANSTYLTGAAHRLARNLHVRLDEVCPPTPPRSDRNSSL